MKRRLPFRRWIRRVVQIAFLLAFVGLILATRPVPGETPSWWLKAYFLADPLILVMTVLAAHAVPLLALFSLVTVLLTLILGRVFCGWICPLGTVHALTGWALDKVQKPAKRRDTFSPWQKAKYYILGGALVMALVGGHWITIFDPLVLLYRTVTTSLLPAAQWGIETGANAVYQADPRIGGFKLTSVTEPAYQYLRNHVFVLPKQAFLGTGLILAFFIAIVAANAYRRRFWCRYVCPLGALLGLLAKRPLLRRKVTSESCNECGLCTTACHGASASGLGTGWKPSECFVCLNCSTTCPRDACEFTFQPVIWRKEPAVQPVGLTRRGVLWAAAGGLVGFAFLRATPQGRGSVYHPRLIRPPGSRPEPDFLARCTACGMCMKVCPTGGLQPAITEAGLEGLFTPHLVPIIGYCDYTCTACGHVCPTEAIRPLTEEEKHQIKIGLAAFDVTRCIPYVYGRNCVVCEEHCPIPEKAIYCVETEVELRDGKKRRIKLPKVDPEKCIGCGVCEYVCPLDDAPGIRVITTNETRHDRHQALLPEVEGEEELPY
ncbi:putative ferredoxin-type protein [Thermogutta terrifontis]|uniref:Putative ferredoxin-type protein n=1 Tax=Thermogutta terrifontis TaxID=1331910 RepID=A0A286RAN7_9BACT|nr:4Fe-4S binding protein [Thermogutta terrifontis]ASV73034.1 putative ferredoxin-type protein [Thermogutta terrifontis]